eukprot:CAMPEP_0113701010 /NCGR_PEP_ID=MMETSP0038_2-20120614/24315_1 /TAXON_ID=2898 /ORGANISM="Cryptomonas paramecium" /LENGTH=126 /DNA_ID=CAMNT_0000624811 /DNA_START=35 /DNA_END=412 /DNA_ORIENTATION=+ /assembly_acc=CAM_ASM_000170
MNFGNGVQFRPNWAADTPMNNAGSTNIPDMLGAQLLAAEFNRASSPVNRPDLLRPCSPENAAFLAAAASFNNLCASPGGRSPDRQLSPFRDDPGQMSPRSRPISPIRTDLLGDADSDRASSPRCVS